jgi:hypothetical protein
MTNEEWNELINDVMEILIEKATDDIGETEDLFNSIMLWCDNEIRKAFETQGDIKADIKNALCTYLRNFRGQYMQEGY